MTATHDRRRACNDRVVGTRRAGGTGRRRVRENPSAEGEEALIERGGGSTTAARRDLVRARNLRPQPSARGSPTATAVSDARARGTSRERSPRRQRPRPRLVSRTERDGVFAFAPWRLGSAFAADLCAPLAATPGGRNRFGESDGSWDAGRRERNFASRLRGAREGEAGATFGDEQGLKDSVGNAQSRVNRFVKLESGASV